jgi:hypothetical protein
MCAFIVLLALSTLLVYNKVGHGWLRKSWTMAESENARDLAWAAWSYSASQPQLSTTSILQP